jgi:hypothetical protein
MRNMRMLKLFEHTHKNNIAVIDRSGTFKEKDFIHFMSG